jgi:hypothetical protein
VQEHAPHRPPLALAPVLASCSRLLDDAAQLQDVARQRVADLQTVSLRRSSTVSDEMPCGM